jgi:hypothetical protein
MTSDPGTRPGVRRWPLAVIAAPAAVSIWSGWVGLGGLSGFGDVQPLPGLLPLHPNMALTLPLGIESYAALALGAWLRTGTTGRARRFARWSALGALVLGMLGQVSYHCWQPGTRPGRRMSSLFWSPACPWLCWAAQSR